MGYDESDTFVGKSHKGVLFHLVERKTKIKALSNLKADKLSHDCIDTLKKEQELSITFDNSKEFA